MRLWMISPFALLLTIAGVAFSAEKNNSPSNLSTFDIFIGIAGVHDQSATEGFLVDGYSDELQFRDALSILCAHGGGRITFLPGEYHWFNSIENNSAGIVIDNANLEIRGFSRSAKINIYRSLPVLTILGGTSPRNVSLSLIHI